MVQSSNTELSTPHQRELWVYQSLSKILFLSYRSKIILIVFVGIHIPLIAVSVWLVVQPSFAWRTYASVIGVALAATLTGTFITLLVLDRLLRRS